MSSLHVHHLQLKLDQLFNYEMIDMSDVKENTPEEKKDHFYSRALAAYTLIVLAGVEPVVAAKSVVDGFGDNGIDALYYDESKKILWLVQSKWIKEGKGEPSPKETLAFCNGIGDIIDFKMERFNDRVKSKEATIKAAIDETSLKIQVVLSYTGNQFGEHNQRAINDLMEELNDTSDLCIFTQFDIRIAHKSLIDVVDGSPVNVDVVLKNWGISTEPYLSYYGQVNINDVAQWWVDHKGKLVSDNIRSFIGTTDVNDEMIRTIKDEPQHFFYFNNGITALCDSIDKKPIGGNDRSSAIFEVKGLKIVNGAQTVGCLGQAAISQTATNASVFVKFISLKDCPSGFAVRVTKATNTQNRVEKKDFVSLDPQQERLRTDFALEGIDYQYKRSSENLPSDSSTCSFDELIVALACKDENVDNCVMAKREVGKLYDDIATKPYIQMFNAGLTTNKAWNSILVHRLVSSYLKENSAKYYGRERGIYVHANLFVEHLTFCLIDKNKINFEKKDFEEYIRPMVERNVQDIINKVFSYVEKKYSSSLIHQVFRNFTKTRDIKDNVK